MAIDVVAGSTEVRCVLQVIADILVPGVVMGDVGSALVGLGGERVDVDAPRLRFQRVVSNKSAEGCETCSGCDRRFCLWDDERRVVDDLLRDIVLCKCKIEGRGGGVKQSKGNLSSG